MPWLLVLNKYLDQWRQENNGKIPSNYREKLQLKEMIRKGMVRHWWSLLNWRIKERCIHLPCLITLTSIHFFISSLGITNDEENFEEAMKAVNTAFGGGHITSSLKAIFEDDACNNLNKQVNFEF